MDQLLGSRGSYGQLCLVQCLKKSEVNPLAANRSPSNKLAVAWFPVDSRHSRAVRFTKTVWASIGQLLFSSGPATISRLIPSRAVDSIQRSSFWSSAHICQEVFKVVPALANANPCAAVGRKLFCVGVVAALEHLSPRLVHPGSAHAVFCFKFWHDLNATALGPNEGESSSIP